MMLRKILVGVLSVIAAGGVIAACDQPEKKESSLPPSKESSLPSSSVEEAKSPESQSEPRPEEKELEASAQKRRFAQRLRVKTPIRTLQVEQIVTIPVEVRNLGPEPWLTETSSSGERPVKLWYHWIDWTQDTSAVKEQASPVVEGQEKKPQRTRQQRLRLPRQTSKLRKEGKVVEFGGGRTPLPHVVNPRESVNVEVTVKAPSRPGAFILRLTMMREGEGSFENKGGAPLDLPVTVTQ
jgi:hypothetical protein